MLILFGEKETKVRIINTSNTVHTFRCSTEKNFLKKEEEEEETINVQTSGRRYSMLVLFMCR